MTDLPLDEWEALANSLPPGPWHHGIGNDRLVWSGRKIESTCIATVGSPEDGTATNQEIDTAEFIAKARTAVPALIARVRELEEERDTWRSVFPDITLEQRLRQWAEQPEAVVTGEEWQFIEYMRTAAKSGVGYGWMQQVIEWEWQSKGVGALGPEHCAYAIRRERESTDARVAEARAEERKRNEALVKTALQLDACASEFDGDLSYCQEYLDAFLGACAAIRVAGEVT
jgi:hypothetical protein